MSDRKGSTLTIHVMPKDVTIEITDVDFLLEIAQTKGLQFAMLSFRQNSKFELCNPSNGKWLGCEGATISDDGKTIVRSICLGHQWQVQRADQIITGAGEYQFTTKVVSDRSDGCWMTGFVSSSPSMTWLDDHTVSHEEYNGIAMYRSDNGSVWANGTLRDSSASALGNATGQTLKITLKLCSDQLHGVMSLDSKSSPVWLAPGFGTQSIQLQGVSVQVTMKEDGLQVDMLVTSTDQKQSYARALEGRASRMKALNAKGHTLSQQIDEVETQLDEVLDIAKEEETKMENECTKLRHEHRQTKKELLALQKQTAISVDYVSTTTGVSVLVPCGQVTPVSFLAKPIIYLRRSFSHLQEQPVEEHLKKTADMPL